MSRVFAFKPISLTLAIAVLAVLAVLGLAWVTILFARRDLAELC